MAWPGARAFLPPPPRLHRGFLTGTPSMLPPVCLKTQCRNHLSPQASLKAPAPTRRAVFAHGSRCTCRPASCSSQVAVSPTHVRFSPPCALPVFSVSHGECFNNRNAFGEAHLRSARSIPTVFFFFFKLESVLIRGTNGKSVYFSFSLKANIQNNKYEHYGSTTD